MRTIKVQRVSFGTKKNEAIDYIKNVSVDGK